MLLAWICTNMLVILYGHKAYEALGSDAYFQGFFLFLTAITVCTVGIRLLGSIIYRFLDIANKLQEKRQNQVEIKSRSSPSNVSNRSKSIQWFICFAMPYLDWKLLISVLNVTLLSPLVGSVTFLWLLAGFALSVLFLITPFGPTAFSFYLLSLRMLGYVEFSLNSFHGKLSRIVFANETDKFLGLGHLSTPKIMTWPRSFSVPDTFVWMKTVLNDSYTKSCLMYMGYIKPFSCILLCLCSLSFLGVSLTLSFNLLIPFQFTIPKWVQILATCVGVLSLGFSMQISRQLDLIGRQVASLSLGEQVKELKLAALRE
jgi:hypothetical protein